MAKDVEVEELKQPVTETKETKQLASDESYEVLYENERKKNRVLLLSSGIFLVLFLVTLGFGLNAAGSHNSDDSTMYIKPQREPGIRYGGPDYDMYR